MKFVFKQKNYLLLILGVLFIATGPLGSWHLGENQNEFSYEIFNFRRLTLAPILIVIGFVIEIFAIMYQPKK